MSIDLGGVISFDSVRDLLSLNKDELSNFMSVFKMIVNEIDNHHKVSDYNGYLMKRYIREYFNDNTSVFDDIRYFATSRRLKKFIIDEKHKQLCKKIVNYGVRNMPITCYLSFVVYSAARRNLYELDQWVNYLIENYDKKDIMLQNIDLLEELRNRDDLYRFTIDTDLGKENEIETVEEENTKTYECTYSSPDYEVRFVDLTTKVALTKVVIKDLAKELPILAEIKEKTHLMNKNRALERICCAHNLMETKKHLLAQYKAFYNETDDKTYESRLDRALASSFAEVQKICDNKKEDYGITDIELDQYVKTRKNKEAKN